MSKDYIFEPRPTFSAYTPNLFLGSYYIEDDFQSDPSMWADPLEDAFVTNAGMKEGKIDTTTYLNDFSAETLLMETKKLDDLEVLPQSYFWKWDHYDAQLQIPTEISEDDFESPAYEEFLEAAVGYDSDNPYFLLVVDSFMDDGEDIDIWAEEADWTRIQTTVRWWKLYDLWMEAEGVDFLTNLAHEDYDWSIRNAGDLQNIGYEIPEPDDDDYYWSMRQAESFAAGNSNHWMTFGQVDYNWATDPDDIPLTDEEFWDIEEWVRKEIRWEIDDDNMPGESSITWTAGLPVTHRFTIHYSWGPAQTTGVNSAEGFEAEMGDLVKDNEWIVFGTKKTGGTTQGNQGMMLGRSPSLKGAKKMMDNFRKKGYGNRYATIGKRLKRQKALLGGLLEAEGSTDMRMPLEVLAGRRAVLGLAGLNDVCWRCSEYGDKIPSHCKNCGVCEECECAVECESRETLGSETLVWKDKTLSFMDWAKQEEASHLKKYAAETFMPPVHKDECTVCVGFADLKDLGPDYEVFLLCEDCITKAKTMPRHYSAESFAGNIINYDGAETYCEVCEQYFPADSKWSKLTDCSNCGVAACVDCMRFGDVCVACASGYGAESFGAECWDCGTTLDECVGCKRDRRRKADYMYCPECEDEGFDSDLGWFCCGECWDENTVTSTKLRAESFEAPYTGAGSLMGITGDTDLSSFTPDELTKSSAIHGDFDTASLDYSGHQNIEVRAEATEFDKWINKHPNLKRKMKARRPEWFKKADTEEDHLQIRLVSDLVECRAELKRVSQELNDLIYDLQTCDDCGGHREELDCTNVCNCGFLEELHPALHHRSESVPVTTSNAESFEADVITQHRPYPAMWTGYPRYFCWKCGDPTHHYSECKSSKYDEALSRKKEMLKQVNAGIKLIGSYTPTQWSSPLKDYDLECLRELRRMIKNNHFGIASHYYSGLDTNVRDHIGYGSRIDIWEVETQQYRSEEGDNPDWDGDPDDFDEQAAWEGIYENWLDEWISGDATEDSIFQIYDAKNGTISHTHSPTEVDYENAEAWYYDLTPVEREAEIFTTTDATPSGFLMSPGIENAVNNIIEDIMSSWDDQFMSESFAANAKWHEQSLSEQRANWLAWLRSQQEGKCPSCGDTDIYNLNGLEFSCGKCHHLWNI